MGLDRDPHRGGPAGPQGGFLTTLGPGREFDIVRRMLDAGEGSNEAVEVGPGDDAALLRPGGWAVSCDLFVEDVHFRRAWLSPTEIGYRAAQAALSDLAAMAAEPAVLLVSVALPAGEARELGPAIQEGVRAAAHELAATVVGGDLTRSPGPIIVDVIVLGRTGEPLLRGRARPGDAVWVTGRLGAAAAAVRGWLEGREPPEPLRTAWVRPRARTREARWLMATGAVRAGLDLSDGLAGDAGHLAAASGAAVVLEAERIPVHPAVRDAFPGEAALELALAGGEDFELCVAAEPGGLEPRVDAFRERFGVALTRVGSVVEGEGVALQAPDGSRRPLTGAFDHFAETGKEDEA